MISPDGNLLAFIEERGNNDIFIYDFRDKSITPFAATESDETYPTFSPDGRWIAYCSDQEGQDEVYIRAVSGAGGAIRISHQGGIEPLWASSGKELFYRMWPGYWNNRFWAVDIQAGTSIIPGKPRMLFESQGLGPSIPLRNWDLSHDGHSFLMVRLEVDEPKPVIELVLIHNWFEEVKRLVPTDK